jgi:hypothetical protein
MMNTLMHGLGGLGLGVLTDHHGDPRLGWRVLWVGGSSSTNVTPLRDVVREEQGRCGGAPAEGCDSQPVSRLWQ